MPGVVVVDLIEVDDGTYLKYLFSDGLKLYQAVMNKSTAIIPAIKSTNCCHLIFFIIFDRMMDKTTITAIKAITAGKLLARKLTT
ncbi:MAG: hypothetical protein NTY30_04030 [Candidatus Berkelbacteria bacterium]|nr:hypothetical protein [Candidatus Berkelbacteria bacterium]